MDVSPYKMLQNIPKKKKKQDNPVPGAHEVGIVYFTVCETVPVCFEDHHVCLLCTLRTHVFISVYDR